MRGIVFSLNTKNFFSFSMGWLLISHALLPSAISYSGPTFKNELIIQAYAEESLQFDLRALLKEEGTGILSWEADRDLPGWLTIDSKLNAAFGTPPANESYLSRFNLTVSDSTARNVATVTVRVTARPKWKVQKPFTLDPIDEGIPFNRNFAGSVVVPGKGKFIISSPNLPEWMRLNPDGAISGTPERKHTGDIKFDLMATTRIRPESSTVTVFLKVKRVFRPPRWKETFGFDFQGTEDQFFNRSVATAVDNVEGTVLTFGLNKPHPWLQVNAEGVLYGKPTSAHVGNSVAEVNVTTILPDGTSVSATQLMSLKVNGIVRPPRWKVATLTLPATSAGSEYSQFLKASVEPSDADGPLRFSLVSETPWASIDEVTGEFKLKLPPTEAGVKTWVVKVTNRAKLSAEVQVKVNVVRLPDPPRWTQHPILTQKQATEEHFFSLDLNDLVKSPDKSKLVFEKVAGPEVNDWLTLDGDGILSGIPDRANYPKTTITVRVKTEFGNDQTELSVPVTKFNHFPVWNLSPIRLKVLSGKVLDLDISQWVQDSDGDPVTFAINKYEGPHWASLSADTKKIQGTPPSNTLEKTQVFVRADDGKGGFSDCAIEITVERVNRAPYWTKSTILLKPAEIGAPYVANVSEFAKDPDLMVGERLRFRKLTGPAWITVREDGQISGKVPLTTEPAPSQKMTVEASDSSGTAATGTIEFLITAKKNLASDLNMELGDCAQGALSNVLWLVDRTALSQELLQDSLGSWLAFYKALENSRVSSRNVVADTDAHLFGKPQPVIKAVDAQEIERQLVGRIPSALSPNNSALWSLLQYFSPTSEESVVKDFFSEQEQEQEQEPRAAEIILITQGRDQHPALSQKIAQKVYTDDQYFESFFKTTTKAKMPFRFHTLTRQCPQLEFAADTKNSLSPENTYSDLSKITGGQYLNDCKEKAVDKLLKISQAVIKRACLLSHQKIDSAVPPSMIRFGGIAIPANKWRYDLNEKKVVILWDETVLSILEN
jgi:hypothetical protein